jgi:hypothetical protein
MTVAASDKSTHFPTIGRIVIVLIGGVVIVIVLVMELIRLVGSMMKRIEAIIVWGMLMIIGVFIRVWVRV